MDMTQLAPYALQGIGFTSLFVGLAAVGLDIVKTLKLGALRKPLQVVAGLAGVVVLLMDQPGRTAMTVPNIAGWICVLTSVAVGLGALGIDLLKVVKLGNLRQPLQYVVGLAGLYFLLLFYGMLAA